MQKLLILLLFSLGIMQIQAQTPTWAEDISCIMYTHCASCHNPNGIAPFSLLEYNEVYPMRSLIADRTLSGEMPPWPPDETYQQHAYERLLDAAEIQTIQDWVAAGAPEGDAGLTAPAPVFESEVLANPDWAAVAPVYTSMATGSDDYQCFVIENPFATDKFITALEVVPGNSSIVHHVLIFKDGSTTPIDLDNADPNPGYDCFGDTNSGASTFLSGWAPGQQATFFTAGMGIRLEAGSNIILQLHYPHGSFGQVDNGTKVNFQMTDDLSLREVYNQPFLSHFNLSNGPLVIPANETRTFYAEFTVPLQATILSVFPHMHLIGRSIKSYAVTPAQETIPLFDIPEWDFEWQGEYTFRQPIVLPPGTTVYSEAFYDNTTANPHNPSDPPQTVTAGEATTDEMMIIFFSYLFYQNNDENIIIDTISHPVEYCDTVSFQPCPSIVAESSIPILDGTYIAGVRLESAGRIPAGGVVRLKGGTEVCLEPGFEAELGADLEVDIEGCQ